MATPNIQLQRQAVSHKAILDFTVQRFPEIPESVMKRFPELRGTYQDLDKLRINLQLQLREQFVAIREMLNSVATMESLDAVKDALIQDIQNLKNEITIIQTVTELGVASENATSDKFGLVKTDKTETLPVVYLKSTIDELLAAIVSGTSLSISSLLSSINNLTNLVNGLIFGALSAPQYKQFLIAASSWPWNHGLGFRPMVEVYDSSWVKMLAYTVNTDDNNLTVTHGYTATGWLVIR